MDPLEFQLDHHSADLGPGKQLAPVRARNMIFRTGKGVKLSSSRRLENIYLVAVGIRPSSMFHPESIEEMLAVHDLARKLGLGMVVRKCGTLVYKVFLFGREKEELAFRIPDLYETMGFKEFIVAQITIANLTGKFLDYPKCCVESFIDHLMHATDQDQEAHDRLILDRNPDPGAFFVERFVPCNIGCMYAIAEGERILGGLRRLEPELAEIYLKLRTEHMEDFRSGRILREKAARDKLLSVPFPEPGWRGEDGN
ncbi:MAG: DUF483 domain-containing protein [Candidatus Thermoplasmatota archaeon]|nr:DUF483 domain-containing protein [Candidatus Thermoplasmatota archaeon]